MVLGSTMWAEYLTVILHQYSTYCICSFIQQMNWPPAMCQALCYGFRVRVVLCQCSFSVTAITNCYKLSAFKQYRFIILQFWRSEILKMPRCWQGCVPSGRCRGEFVFLPFPPSRGHLFLGSWPLPPSSKIAAWHLLSYLTSAFVFTQSLCIWSFCLLIRMLVIILDYPSGTNIISPSQGP